MRKEMLWVDRSQNNFFRLHIEELEKIGINVTVLRSVEDDMILSLSSGKDIILIHPRTIRPMASLKDVLESLRKQYPQTKLGICTNTKHPYIEHLVDFYVEKPIIISKLEENITRLLSDQPSQAPTPGVV